MSRGMTTVAEAQLLLRQLKAASLIPYTFVPDELGADRLPKWVKTPSHTTDGHLLELAREHKAVFATCDENIPGSFVIPLL